MKKIVIKTDCPEADNMLYYIMWLFPECEIQMLPVKTKSFKDASTVLGFATAHKQKKGRAS